MLKSQTGIPLQQQQHHINTHRHRRRRMRRKSWRNYIINDSNKNNTVRDFIKIDCRRIEGNRSVEEEKGGCLKIIIIIREGSKRPDLHTLSHWGADDGWEQTCECESHRSGQSGQGGIVLCVGNDANWSVGFECWWRCWQWRGPTWAQHDKMIIMCLYLNEWGLNW